MGSLTSACCDSEDGPNNKPASVMRVRKVGQEPTIPTPATVQKSTNEENIDDDTIDHILQAKAKLKKKI